ncbi:hypothetical protein [Methylobacterium nonmethylotrophicum]|uniref:Uncharacterized protein n=1 Tax=Methylobacterium nonmethylotrophicum TaxID=1141884 RepID=A0A4Z0NQW6_9HYPH|nr:hypothetical protein [Methylobacterium nonmethylotrophicum]TGD98725.1 hypothetical protein EU555_15445 [Methylobacterium nonmethylotrophicum]
MSLLSPRTITLATPRPTCVVDVSVALSPWGLWAVRRLARAACVWLARAQIALLQERVEEILKDDAFVARVLAGFGGTATAAERLEAATCLWNAARPILAFSPDEEVWWPCDRAEDSVMPRGTDPSIVARLDALAQGLELRRPRARYGLDLLSDCARDTLALAAALGPGHVFVLTAIPTGREAPDLAGFLASAAIPCRHVAEAGQRRLLRETLLPLFVQAGLTDLLATGSIRLACLHLIVPRAPLALPGPLSDDDYAYDAVCDDAEGPGDPTLWDDAISAWWEVS